MFYAIAICAFVAYVMWKHFTKPSRRRADLEFKFRTCQITEEEMQELSKLRAA